MKRRLVLLIVVATTGLSVEAADPEIVSVSRIWDHGRHNAFTDLIRFRDRWWCTFREGTGHAGDDGRVRVIVSSDGKEWKSAGLLEQDGVDLRDPKLSITPDGRLMLIMGGSLYNAKRVYQTRSPRVSFSSDGLKWTRPRKLLAEDHWLWRVTWHKGTGYSISKLGNGKDPRRVMLYSTRDGLDWKFLTEFHRIPGWPNEATIRFLDRDEMVVLLRRNKTAWIGTSRPPFTDWKWTDTGQRVGGPNFIRVPDGSLWASGRRYGDRPQTVLARMTRTGYKPVLTLPSGGDCSYAGMVWHEGLLWISYYSSHEGKTNIYLAKVRLPGPRASRRTTGRLDVTVSSRLVTPNLPADPLIDFAVEARRQGLEGVLDPDSIRVVNRATKQEVAHSLGPGFRHGDSGRVRWLISDPRQMRYVVTFRTSPGRRLASTRDLVPLIGVGDLLRYNATGPRRIGGLVGLSRMVDLTGDGRLDLVTAGMYTFESGWPGVRTPHDWGGLWCRPALDRGAGEPRSLLFGDRIPLRYKTARESKEFHQFNAGYMHGDAADLNGDGRPDLLFTAAAKSSRFSRITDVHRDVHLFLDSGDRDAGGMPIYLSAGRVPHPPEYWGPVRAVDLDGDRVVDLVLGSMFRDEAGPRSDVSACYIRNRNPKGWPFEPSEPVTIEVGRRPCFFDVDGDGRLDSVCLVTDSRTKRLNRSSRLGWRRNRGEFPPRFAAPRVLEEVDLKSCYSTAAVTAGPRPGVVVSYQSWQRAAFLEAVSSPPGDVASPRRRRFVTRKLLAPSPEIALGDQATPFPCDWDNDGDWDLLVGGGYGDVRIVINSGTTGQPRFEPARPVLADRRPIEVHMSNVFPGLEEYGHNMGYPHPSFVDWDGDGLRDVMLPNITNRVFWYRNVGTPSAPRFGPRRQLICDGFAETARTLRATASLLGADTKEWTKRVPDPHSPFGWRSRGGFGDFNGDGLCDMVTTDGQGPPDNNRYAAHSAIFVQYRDGRGRRRLKKQQVITLPDGKPLTNVVGQPAQLIPVDWDRDGLLDLVINHGATLDTAPALVRNIGTRTKPRFDVPRRLKCFGEELSGIAKHGPYYGVGDLDGDGRSDLLACPEMGTYHFFRRTALDMPRRPRFVIGPADASGRGTR